MEPTRCGNVTGIDINLPQIALFLTWFSAYGWNLIVTAEDA